MREPPATLTQGRGGQKILSVSLLPQPQMINSVTGSLFQNLHYVPLGESSAPAWLPAGYRRGMDRAGKLQSGPTQRQEGHLFPGTTKPDAAQDLTMKTGEPFRSLQKSKGFLGREAKGFTEQPLCTNIQPTSLFFNISWKRMSHLNIAGNQIEVGENITLGKVFLLNVCIVIFAWKKKIPKFRLEMWHS